MACNIEHFYIGTWKFLYATFSTVQDTGITVTYNIKKHDVPNVQRATVLLYQKMHSNKLLTQSKLRWSCLEVHNFKYLLWAQLTINQHA